MRRSPPYPYSTFPHGFYGPPAQDVASFGHRPHRSSLAPATPNTPSVINIPVFDSAPPCPSSSPPQKHSNTSSPPSPAAVPLIDSSTAATKIQSHFRGFNVRRHRPLFHLRSIAKARKQLKSLQSELESPAFPLKVKTNEKELLRFSESVMAVILSLDAIEGSMEEVRSQRKEATKMAIKLQDAMDAIILQRGENAALQPTDGSLSAGFMATEEESVPYDQRNVKMVQGVYTTSESVMEVNSMLGESTPPEESVSNKCLSNANNQEMVGNIVSPLLPRKVENDDQLVEAGMSMPCSSEAVPKHVEVMHNSEQDMTSEIVEVMYAAEQGLTRVTGENAGDSFIMQEESSTTPEEHASDKCMLNGDNKELVDDIIPLLLPDKVEDVDQQVEADVSTPCCSGSIPPSQLVGVIEDAEQYNTGVSDGDESMHVVQQDVTHVTGEESGDKATHQAVEEGNAGIQTLDGIAPDIHAQNDALVAIVNKDTIVDDLNAANHGYVQEASSNQSSSCMDVVQKAEEGLRQDAKFSPETPIAEENCDYLHYSTIPHQNQLQGLSTPFEMVTEDNCHCDCKGAPTLQGGCCDAAYENASGVANSGDEANKQSSTLAMLETSSSPDSALLLQLSEDCKQLRSLVGKLLVQNKAQSKVLCALGERLELLEQEQKLNMQQRMSQKRKLWKGSKRRGKCCKWE